MSNERKQLEELGRRRRRHRAGLAGLRGDLADAVRSAHAAGVPITEIARLSGFSRPAVYSLIEKEATK